MAKKAKVDVYQEVTDTVIKALSEGRIPWHRPWTELGEPQKNLVSKKPYRGINQFLLSMSSYASPYWLTYKQAAAKGGQVRKGEKGTMVVFWSMLKNRSYDPSDKGSKKTIPYLRYYTIFNVEQVDGLKNVPEPAKIGEDFDPVESAEAILNLYVDAPKVIDGGDRASYSPPLDQVRMPLKGQFESPEAYYATKFHELAHSTGHTDRLNRKELNDITVFDIDEYSKEELVAEMAAAMLCGVATIDNERTITNTKAYIQGWIAKLQDDKKLLVSAAGQAQKAADYVQGITPARQQEEVPQAVAA